MNKKVMIGVGAGCVVAGCIAAATKGVQGGPKQAAWDRMRRRMEEMPADFPPRIMFDNIETTRANTEEILEMLRQQSTSTSSP